MQFIKQTLMFSVASLICGIGLSHAGPITSTSQINGGSLTALGVTEVGGIVFQAKGLNGAILTSQMSASSLFEGYSLANPFDIGTQSGFNAGVLGALGGGFSKVSVRLTLYDGDTGIGNFDENRNYLVVNGVGSFALTDFTDVTTIETNSVGTEFPPTNSGFRNNKLDTGFFNITDATALASIHSNLMTTETLSVGLYDYDPNDNYFDFTRGIDGSLLDVGQGPTVGTVPEPGSLAIAAVLGGCGLLPRRRRRS